MNHQNSERASSWHPSCSSASIMKFESRIQQKR